jgi:hypothetical protein
MGLAAEDTERIVSFVVCYVPRLAIYHPRTEILATTQAVRSLYKTIKPKDIAKGDTRTTRCKNCIHGLQSRGLTIPPNLMLALHNASTSSQIDMLCLLPLTLQHKKCNRSASIYLCYVVD